MMRDGKFDLSWMRANPAGWGTHAKPSVGGLTVTDINVGPYGQVPDHGGVHGSMAPRGAYVPPETPSLGCYDIDDKAIVWAENAGELYEESVARQWSSARDIPWERPEPRPGRDRPPRCPALHPLEGGRFHRGGSAGNVAWAHHPCLPGGDALPGGPDLRRGPPHGRLPETGARERRRPHASLPRLG